MQSSSSSFTSKIIGSIIKYRSIQKKNRKLDTMRCKERQKTTTDRPKKIYMFHFFTSSVPGRTQANMEADR